MASSSSAAEEMIFDFASKKLIPASTLWNAHAGKAEEVMERYEHRGADLDALVHDLTEARMITDVREHTVCTKIDDEAETLIHIIKMRAAELKQQVQEASREQHKLLDGLIDKAATARSDMDALAQHVDARKAAANRPSVHVRLDSLFKLEETLQTPMFFDAPPQSLFTVVIKAMDIDNCIALNKVGIPMRVPPSLAVRMTNKAEVEVAFQPESRGPFGVAPGVFHYLGTGGRSRPFINPFEQGLVNVSGVEFVVGGPAHLLRDPTSRDSVSFRPSRTRSDRNGRIVFDFGEDRRICIDAYALQHGHEATHAALRSWSVIGSNDGEHWAVLDQRYNETALGASPFNTALFDLTCDADMDLPDFVPPSAAPSRTFYRFIGLMITGANAAGPSNYHIEVGHVEFYGRVRMAANKGLLGE